MSGKPAKDALSGWLYLSTDVDWEALENLVKGAEKWRRTQGFPETLYYIYGTDDLYENLPAVTKQQANRPSYP